ncbi:Pyrimidine-specific ribonucleoside hydrolase RihA [bacterium HR39]|nr:Pyrimidine-specific ribonucleoside hydrolase RihA [bacterium HR39]
MRRTVVLDCDPGQDDAVAILLALASPGELEVRAIMAVAGNVPLVRTVDNALRLVELAGACVPVHAGCARPLLRELVTAEHVHGETGIDGADLPHPAREPEREHAALAIVRHLSDPTAERPTLVATGPLTNVALALTLAPDLARRLDAIVLMGGAVGLGNVTPAAEFNMYVDPHAARIVFESGARIVMFPLDVTHQVLVTEERLGRIRALGTRSARAVAGMLAFYRGRGRTGGAREGPLHDPCTVAWLVDPGLFCGRAARVEVECESPLGLGRTYVDLHGTTGRPPNAEVMLQADAERFFELLVERLARLP